MIRPYLLLGSAVLLLALFSWALLERQGRMSARADLEAAQASLAVAQAELAQAEETAKVHRVYLDRAAQDARKWAEIERDLRSMEGRNEPLTPHLRAVAERLWPEN